MNNKRGFTLIELLAVIVILAVIALIVTPTITGVISNVKKSAALRSAEGYISAAQYYYQTLGNVDKYDTNIIDDLKVNGSKPKDGSVYVDENGNVGLALLIDGTCYKKQYNAINSEIEVIDNPEKCMFVGTNVKTSDYAILKGTDDQGLNDSKYPLNYIYADDIYNSGNSILFLGSTELKNIFVKSITKVDKLPASCVYKWDASDTEIEGNTPIGACAVGNDASGYDVSLVSEKPIMAPKNSHALFAFLGNENRIADDIDNDTYAYTKRPYDFSWLNTAYTEDMSCMFYGMGYGTATQINLGNNFDTSNVVNMKYMFSNTGHLSMTELNLGDKFYTGNVVDMSRMFYNTGYSSMTKLDLGENFNTSSLTDASFMFYETGYNSMKELDLGNKFNTKNVVSMTYMFSNAGYNALTKLNLGRRFNTSKVTDMSGMFYGTGYNAMISLDLGDEFDTANVNDMSFMFQRTGYNVMTTLDLGDKFDTGNVINMERMFRETGFNAMTILNLGDKFNTSKVNNMECMFYETGYESMTDLKLGDKFNTSNVTNMSSLFEMTGYTSLKSLDLGNYFSTDKATKMSQMFQNTGSTSMTTINLGPAFKKVNVPNGYQFWINVGGPGSITKVSSAIYKDETHFKYGVDSPSYIQFGQSFRDNRKLVVAYE